MVTIAKLYIKIGLHDFGNVFDVNFFHALSAFFVDFHHEKYLPNFNVTI